MIDSIWHILLELAPWLFVGALVSGLLHAFMPADFLGQRLQGPWGVVKGALLGLPMPLCSCAVIPAGLGLKKQGASDGATVAFMISTPQTGADSLLVVRAFLGWPFALFTLGSSLVLGLIAGWWADAAGKSAAIAGESPSDCCAAPPPAGKNKLLAVVEFGVETLRSIWRWLVFGIVVSAAIEQFLPPGSLDQFAGEGGLVAMLAALVIGLPLYVCTTASVPMAAALVHAGFPTGAALVFLIAGPATNVATMGAIYRVLGGRTLAIYLTTIAVGSVAFGLLFDWLIAPASATLPAMAHEHHSWWGVASAAALLALLGWFACEDLARLVRARRSEPAIEEVHTPSCCAHKSPAPLPVVEIGVHK